MGLYQGSYRGQKGPLSSLARVPKGALSGVIQRGKPSSDENASGQDVADS
jgi:hypothetical protein